MSDQFPDIAIDGAQVNPRLHIERGTGMAMFGAFFLAILGTIVGIVVSYGVILIVLLLYPPFAWYVRKKAMAMIHGSGLLVSATQFPQIHQCAKTFQRRLGMTKDVSVYVVEDNVVNALAVKYGKKNVVLVTDGLIHGCLASGSPEALAFILGHELAHVALNHNGLFRSWMAQHLKRLGRLDEYSADAVASALVGDRGIAFTGLLLLTIGYALLPYVNPDSVVAQAQEVAQNKYSKRAERSLTHPLLLNRLYRILQER